MSVMGSSWANGEADSCAKACCDYRKARTKAESVARSFYPDLFKEPTSLSFIKELAGESL